MRALFFRKLLRLLGRHTPRILVSLEIQILLWTTARGFGVKGKRVWHHAPRRALREYAQFTVSCTRQGGADPSGLRAEAYRTGSIVRRITGFRESRDIEALVFYLYKNIGITMDGSLPGEVTVRSCYFSRYYQPAQCALMSSVDAGVIAGIAGGGNLRFTKRLTEGERTCRAEFSEPALKRVSQRSCRGAAGT